jgi:hypothetical protein
MTTDSQRLEELEKEIRVRQIEANKLKSKLKHKTKYAPAGIQFEELLRKLNVDGIMEVVKIDGIWQLQFKKYNRHNPTWVLRKFTNKDWGIFRIKKAIKSKISNELTIDERNMIYQLNKYREFAYLITDSLTILNIQCAFYHTEILVDFNGYRYKIYTKDNKISKIQADLDQFYRTNHTLIKLNPFVVTYKKTKLSQLESELQDIYERIQNLKFEIHKIKKFK